MNEDNTAAMSSNSSTHDKDKSQPKKLIATIVYALQAASFLFGITFIIAVVISYIKKDDVSGTWLESHFRWQIRTFWFSVLWSIIGFTTLFIVVGYFVLFANAIWLIYRIVKGWLRLAEDKPMYTEA